MTDIPPLNDEQRALAGDPAAVAWAMGLARRWALRRGWAHERDEVEVAALEGLCAAARLFDPARGVPFRKYAGACVVGSIKDGLRRVIDDRRGRFPRPVPLDAFDSLDDHGLPASVGDALASGEWPVGWELESHDAVIVLSGRLPAKYGAALAAYYTRAGMRMRDVAAELGTSESRVSQMVGRDGPRLLRENLRAREQGG